MMAPINQSFGPGALRAVVTGAAISLCLATGANAQTPGPELRWGVEMEIATVDPAFHSNTWENMATINAYDGLVWPDPEKGVAPRIAESWTISPDGVTYTFKIRRGILFHDGGELTAEDVAFSLKRLLTLNGPGASNIRSVDVNGIQVIDRDTVSVRLTSPSSSFLPSLLTFRVLSKKIVMENLADGAFGEFKDYGVKYLRTQDAGSGPYRIVKNEAGAGIVMEYFDKYAFGQWKPDAPKRIVVNTIPEMATIGAKLRAGEIDMAGWALPVQVQNQLVGNPKFTVQRDNVPEAWIVVVNNKKPPFDDPAVRKAVSSVYDWKTVTQHILGGGTELRGPVPASLLGGKCDGIEAFPFDIEKGKQYLAQSKYSAEDLKKFNISIAAVAGSERFKNIALMLATNMKKIGLNAEVKSVRWTEMVQSQTTPDSAYHLAVFYEGAKYPDPNVLLVYYMRDGWGDAFTPGGMYYENPQASKLINEARNSTDIATQRRLYCDASRLIAADAPSIFSHNGERISSRWSYVSGLNPGVGALFYDVRFENWKVDVNSPDYRANRR